ncbi:MAG: hypothetical protein FVQ81_02210 [Candidatus Glassbacteria bacterium]|nr:hypothetical protein [Candidatus Glassbacteria bacterium]
MSNLCLHKRIFTTALMAACLVVPVLSAAVPGAAGKYRTPYPGPSLAAFRTRITTGNRIEFNMANNGYLAVDPNRGSITPGGFWPSGSEDAYVFAAGLHVMGVIDSDGDGISSDIVETQLVFDSEWREGRPTDDPDDPASRLYFSTSQADLDEWPEEFMVVDPNEASPTFGQRVPDVRSELDVVAIYTDIGGPVNTAAGALRLGVEVHQHVMFYSLSEMRDIMFVIWDIYNASRYVADPGVVPGYDIHDAYVNLKTDFDIGENALDDRAAVSPVRNMSIAFDSDFSEIGFSGTPAFLGISFLEAPTESDGIDNQDPLFPQGNGLSDETFGEIQAAGIKDPRTGLFLEFHPEVHDESAERMSLFTLNTNGGERPDPADDAEAYRILKGDPDEVRTPRWDPYADLIVADVVGDLRQNIVSGPFEMPDLDAAGPKRVAAAVYFARPATVNVDLNNLSIDGELRPLIDLWAVAREVHRSGFVVPSPPPTPAMRLVPGDRQVTITWNDLPVDATDPYALTGAAAQYEPVDQFPGITYRAQDFEGFRVYRSLTGNPDDARLIAQYDLDNEYRTYKITRAVATAQGQQDMVEEIPLGDNSGLAFSFTDRGNDIGGLVNGVPMFYAVTAYDFNPALIGDESLESSLNFRGQDAEGRFFQLAIPRSPSTSIVAGSGNWQQVDFLGNPVEASQPPGWELVANVGDGTLRGSVIEFTDPVAPVTNAFAASLSQVVVIDPDNVPELGGYLVVDSTIHTNKDTRNHIHFVHFEDSQGNVSTVGRISIPWHEIEGLYPGDEVVDQQIPFNFSGPLVGGGPLFNGIAYFRKGGLDAAKVTPLKVRLAGQSDDLPLFRGELGSYEETGLLVYEPFEVHQPFFSLQLNGLVSRKLNIAGQFAPGSIVITWQADGEVNVWDAANNVPLRFNERAADGYGFLPLDTYEHEEIYEDQVLTPENLPTARLVRRAIYVADPDVPGLEWMSLYVRGVELQIRKIFQRPAPGDEWTLNMDYLILSNQTVRYTSPFAGMRVALHLEQAGRNTDPGRLEQIKVVPNPYIASSVFDTGPNRRMVMFTHLPLRAEIRIYTVSGNLVNALEHGPGEQGSIGGVADRNSGQYSFDLTTRFGDQIASGIYYFHIRDLDTGETQLGKFSIIQ